MKLWFPIFSRSRTWISKSADPIWRNSQYVQHCRFWNRTLDGGWNLKMAPWEWYVHCSNSWTEAYFVIDSELPEDWSYFEPYWFWPWKVRKVNR